MSNKNLFLFAKNLLEFNRNVIMQFIHMYSYAKIVSLLG